MVNESLGLLLDPDIHVRLEWELAIFSLCGAVAVPTLSWLMHNAVKRNRGIRKAIRQTGIRVDRHENDIVAKLRDGEDYPPLPTDPDD